MRISENLYDCAYIIFKIDDNNGIFLINISFSRQHCKPCACEKKRKKFDAGNTKMQLLLS
jgi:hypothetical protein